MPTDLPFEAYQGTDPYLFVSYAHADAGVVYPEMEWLHGLGHRIWYDEGIELGSEWSDAIARAIEGCAQFLVFMSPRAAESKHVQREVYYALEEGREILRVHLDPTDLPSGLKMQLGPVQAILKHEVSDEDYRGKVKRVLAAQSRATPGIEEQVQAPPDPKGLRAISSPSPAAAPEPATKVIFSELSAPFVVPKPSPKDFTNGLGMEMVWCPSGTFLMGSPESEEGRDHTETLHRVTLTKDFWISRFPVTQEQWQSCMGSNPSYWQSGVKWLGEACPLDTSDFPVESITWRDAVKFCKRLSKSERRKYTLPTEAQWEYACRAGAAGPHYGEDPHLLGWFFDKSGERAHAVGGKQPNDWGIYDMHGNVWEWCLDRLDSQNAPYDERDATDPCNTHGEDRVLRGGAWSDTPKDGRSASRNANSPTNKTSWWGLRVAVHSRPSGI